MRTVRTATATTIIDEQTCVRCGACCTNPSENVREGVTAYVEIAPGDAILKKKDLVRKLVVLDAAGVPHLRLAKDGRCLALRGAIGREVRCEIYHHRPTPCRRVEPGGALCLRYRADAGLPTQGGAFAPSTARRCHRVVRLTGKPDRGRRRRCWRR